MTVAKVFGVPRSQLTIRSAGVQVTTCQPAISQPAISQEPPCTDEFRMEEVVAGASRQLNFGLTAPSTGTTRGRGSSWDGTCAARMTYSRFVPSSGISTHRRSA